MIDALNNTNNQVFDFTVLSGIGPSRNKALHDSGIKTANDFIKATGEFIRDSVGGFTITDEVIEEWKQSLRAMA